MAKHLSLEDRNLIAQRLNEGCSFKAIAAELGRNCTSISREVRNHLTFKKVGAPGRCFNACRHRFSCKKFHICKECHHKKFSSFCKNCKHCNSVCSEFEAEICQKLLAPPYVCNGCKKRNGCRKIKYIYKAKEADEQYRNVLSSSRQGINLTEEETNDLSNIIIPAIKKGHSPAMILMNNNDITICEKTIYNYVEQGVFEGIGNIDLPRKVKYKKRRKHSHKSENNNSCRIGRTYEDFNNYII